MDEAASGIAEKIEKLEPAFAEEELLPDAAVKKAMALAKTAEKPVVIADTQDNPGAGGTQYDDRYVSSFGKTRCGRCSIRCFK